MKNHAMCRAVLLVLICCFSSILRAAEPAGGTAQKLFCWKVTGSQGVVYLFGTVHVGRADLYPLAPIIETSFKQADTLITEADLIEPQDTSRVLKLLLQKGVYPAGDTVENHIGQETRAHLLPYVAKSKELASDYARLKPWFLTVSIAVIEAKRMGFDMSEGLDRHFVDKATEMHKPIATLETTEFQLDLISSFPEELQDRLLLSSLLDAEHKSDGMDRMLQAWKSGDADEMEKAKLHYVRENPSLKPVFEKMFDQRNDGMTRQIEQFLQTPKTYFVAVGAGHLTGERGILSQLRGKNYDVEQLRDGAMQRAERSDHRTN